VVLRQVLVRRLGVARLLDEERFLVGLVRRLDVVRYRQQVMVRPPGGEQYLVGMGRLLRLVADLVVHSKVLLLEEMELDLDLGYLGPVAVAGLEARFVLVLGCLGLVVAVDPDLGCLGLAAVADLEVVVVLGHRSPFAR
jgi:ABC-type hemin transport system ATPase subunit